MGARRFGLALVLTALVLARAQEVAECEVGEWSPLTACVRTGVRQWSQARERAVTRAGSDCPPLSETIACEPPRSPPPARASEAQLQAALALLAAAPLGLDAGLDEAVGSVPDEQGDLERQAAPPSDIAAGRALWEAQADDFERHTCPPFNGVSALLAHAGSSAGAAAAHAALDAATSAAREAVEAARGAPPPGSNNGASTAPKTVTATSAAAAAAAAMAAGRHASAAAGAAAAQSWLAWNGVAQLGVRFASGAGAADADQGEGVLSAPGAQAAAAVAADALTTMLPWAAVDADADGLSWPGGLNLTMQLDGAPQGSLLLSSTSPASLALLAALGPDLARSFGVGAIASAGASSRTNAAAASAGVLLGRTSGVRELALGLAGHWTPSELGTTLGMRVPLPDDVFAFAPEPLLLHSALPSVLYVTAPAEVPLLGVASGTAVLAATASREAALTVYGPTPAAPHLVLPGDLTLVVQPDGSMVGSADGELAGLPVAVAVTISADRMVTFTMSNSEPSAPISGVVAALFAESAAPSSWLSAALQDMQFGRITVTYTDSSGTGGGAAMMLAAATAGSGLGTEIASKSSSSSSSSSSSVSDGGSSLSSSVFSLLAVPAPDGAPQLKSALGALGIGLGDVLLQGAVGGAGAVPLGFGLRSPTPLQLPAPFTRVGSVMLAAGPPRSPGQPLVLEGSLPAALALPGVTAPVPFTLAAVLPLPAAGGAPNLALELAGSVISPLMALSDFKFVSFGPMTLAASVGLEPSALRTLNLQGPIMALGVAGRAAFTQQPSSGLVAADADAAARPPALGLALSLPSLDVGLLASAQGAALAPGAVPALLTGVRGGLAPGATALELQATSLEFLGMRAPVALTISADGLEMVASFNGSEFSAAFEQLVVSRVSATLQAASHAVAAAQASSAVAGPQPTAQDSSYQSELIRARAAYDSAAAAFSGARKRALDSLSSAQTRATAAAAAFDTAKRQRTDSLAAAAARHNAAQATLCTAEARAAEGAVVAKGAMAAAQALMDEAVSSALMGVEVASLAAAELRSAYAANNSRCDAYPLSQSSCAAAASSWAAFQVASEQLDAAAAELERAASGVSATRLTAARASLRASHVDGAALRAGGSGGPVQAARDAAAALSAAHAAASDLVGGTEWAALQAASSALSTSSASVRASASATSAQWRALSAAGVGLMVASAKAAAGATAATASPTTLAAAAGGLATALDSATSPGWLRLNSFSVNFVLRRGVASLLANYNVAAGGPGMAPPLLGRFALDVGPTSPTRSEDLTLLLADLLRGDALGALRAADPALAGFV